MLVGSSDFPTYVLSYSSPAQNYIHLSLPITGCDAGLVNMRQWLKFQVGVLQQTFQVWKELHRLFLPKPPPALAPEPDAAGIKVPLLSANWPLWPNGCGRQTAPDACNENNRQYFWDEKSETDWFEHVCPHRFNLVFLLFFISPIGYFNVQRCFITPVKCLIKQEIMHRIALWEKLLKPPPFSSQKPARPDQIKWFDTFSANRIRLINSHKCSND